MEKLGRRTDLRVVPTRCRNVSSPILPLKAAGNRHSCIKCLSGFCSPTRRGNYFLGHFTSFFFHFPNWVCNFPGFPGRVGTLLEEQGGSMKLPVVAEGSEVVHVAAVDLGQRVGPERTAIHQPVVPAGGPPGLQLLLYTAQHLLIMRRRDLGTITPVHLQGERQNLV